MSIMMYMGILKCDIHLVRYDANAVFADLLGICLGQIIISPTPKNKNFN